jgi:ABC-2 type transport system ATP-binding protein
MSVPAIEITDLTKFYGKDRGIDHINLEIREGEIFGFIGPNGAGKSTTIRILLNLIFPTGGSARIMGLDVISRTKAIKYLTGYIPSDANSYSSMTVRECLTYFLRFYHVRNGDDRMTELCGLFDLELDRKIHDLSRGNQKKVSIVQSLMHSPKLLIMDEPTTGLDPLMQEKFFELLRSENRKGTTIFFSSHILSEVQLLCKRIAIIREGKIAQVEDIDTLRRKQLKKVHIGFSNPEEDAGFECPGMENVLRDAGMLSFMYPGDVNTLVGRLAGRKIKDLTIEEPSLEEIFMHYYH